MVRISTVSFDQFFYDLLFLFRISSFILEYFISFWNFRSHFEMIHLILIYFILFWKILSLFGILNYISKLLFISPANLENSKLSKFLFLMGPISTVNLHHFFYDLPFLFRIPYFICQYFISYLSISCSSERFHLILKYFVLFWKISSHFGILNNISKLPFISHASLVIFKLLNFLFLMVRISTVNFHQFFSDLSFQFRISYLILGHSF
jgi:hypothetical protein